MPKLRCYGLDDVQSTPPREDWVLINFPVDIAATVSEWLCLVCGEIFREADMIPGRPGYHNCPANVMSVFAKVPKS
jgi:hypothetical protein